MSLKEEARDHEIILISKDINLRIKATILGIKTEDYANDRVVDDLDLLFSGSSQLATDFWEAHGKQIESWQEEAPRLTSSRSWRGLLLWGVRLLE